MTLTSSPIEVQAHLHHQYFLGLQLMVSVEEGKEIVGEWMFRLFRRQHEEKFLSGFGKLGLDDLPHAVACAKYHVLSNGVGGVRVEYMEETDTKAWLRFRYPRWMYDGPAICGIPVEASRGVYERLVRAEWRVAEESAPRLRLCVRGHDRAIRLLWIF